MSFSTTGSTNYDTLALYCLVVDDHREIACVNDIFPLFIEKNKSVGELKENIKVKEAPRLDHLAAHELIVWKLLSSLSVDDENVFKMELKALRFDRQNSDPKIEFLRPMDSLLRSFPDQPLHNHLHLIVQLPPNVSAADSRKRKRTNSSGCQYLLLETNAFSVLECWRSKHISAPLPSIAELQRIIESPLLGHEKVPITSSRMQDLVSSDSETQDICTSEDVELLFRASNASTPLDKLFFAAFDAPPIGGTEESFHYFWDENIRMILQLLVPFGKSTRNSSKHAATRTLRPDYAFLLGNICPFRGEEKPPGSTEDPKAELSNKLEWAYAPAPYVLGKLCL